MRNLTEFIIDNMIFLQRSLMQFALVRLYVISEYFGRKITKSSLFGEKLAIFSL